MDDERVAEGLKEMIHSIIDVGIFTVVAWFLCHPQPNVWLCYLGWCVGCFLVFIWKART